MIDPAAFTNRQRKQLLALREAKAVSRTESRSIHALTLAGEGSTIVLGRLRDLGLVDSRVVRRGVLPMSGQWTEYWLTDAGAAQAEALAGGRPASDGARDAERAHASA